MALWLLIGTGAAVLVIAHPVVMSAVPDGHRGRAYGICSSALMAAQGLGILAAGFLAGHLSATRALVMLGGAGAVVLVSLARRGSGTADAWSAVPVGGELATPAASGDVDDARKRWA